MSAVGEVEHPARGHRPCTGPLVGFLGVTFAWSWGLWLLGTRVVASEGLAEVLIIAGRFGPTAGAVVVTLTIAGRTGLGRLLASFRRWRAPRSVWLTVTVGPLAVVLAAIGLAAALGTPAGEFNDPATAYQILPAFLVILVLGGPLGEELGWRGFALDRLQGWIGPVGASLVLGVVWGLWHLPLFLDPGQVQSSLPLGLYLGQTTTTAVLYTWVWNRSLSLPLVLVLHTMTNLMAGVFPLLAPEAPTDLAFGLAVGLAGLAALALIVVTRGRLGAVSRPGAPTAPA